MSLLLVADIGGTNARFGLVEHTPNASKPNYTSAQQVTLKCADYPDMGTMVKASCAEFGVALPAAACFAIAGPIQQGHAQITNLGWKFNIDSMRAELGMDTLHIINDFAGLAYAVPFLSAQETQVLYPGEANPEAPIVVMGPGTGFGMAILVPNEGRWEIIPTEGGHASFAPTNEKELAIKSFLLKDQSHVSVENILSGAGLVNLYRALAHIASVTPQPYTPADVSTKGLSNQDPICREAVVTFCNTLGAVAGDKALSTGARGGVVIAGGITPRLMSLLPETDFAQRYTNKGPMKPYLSKVPVTVMMNDKSGLVGAAAWLIHNTPSLKPR